MSSSSVVCPGEVTDWPGGVCVWPGGGFPCWPSGVPPKGGGYPSRKAGGSSAQPGGKGACPGGLTVLAGLPLLPGLGDDGGAAWLTSGLERKANPTSIAPMTVHNMRFMVFLPSRLSVILSLNSLDYLTII